VRLDRADRTWTARRDCAERDGIKADAVTAIRCRTSAGPVPRLWEPLAAKHAPPNGYAAKFSLPYLLATIFVRGRARDSRSSPRPRCVTATCCASPRA